MKTDNIFDLMYDDPDNNERTGTENKTIADSGSVESLVMKKITTSGHLTMKKRRGRKLTAAFIAAALSVGILCTTVAATGLMDNIFGGRVEVKSESIPVTAPMLDVKSDDLDIVLDGMTGDDENIFAILTITKKDGSNFLESAEDIEIKSEEHENRDFVIKTASSSDKQFVINSQSEVDYGLENEKTISAFLMIHKEKPDENSILISEKEIKARRLVKILYQAQPEQREDGSLFYSYRNNKELMEKYIEDYKPQLKENEIVVFDGERCAVCVFEEYMIPLEYEASFKSDISGESKELLGESVSVSTDNGSFVLTGLTATRTGLRLRAESVIGSDNPLLSGCSLIVNLKDGSSINADYYTSFSKTFNTKELNNEKGVTLDLFYLFTERDNTYGIKFTPIDPKEIVSVTIGGETIEPDNK